VVRRSLGNPQASQKAVDYQRRAAPHALSVSPDLSIVMAV
jgi:hypothetical protein